MTDISPKAVRRDLRFLRWYAHTVVLMPFLLARAKPFDAYAAILAPSPEQPGTSA